MSNCPYLLPRVRDGLRMGNGEVVDSMINDGLWCAFEQCHMGNAGEVVAEHYKVGRAAQDDYAARSHQKAARATDEGAFADEILPIVDPAEEGRSARRRSRRGDPRRHDRRGARRAEAGVQEGRHGHRRQRAGRQRRRVGARRDGGRAREVARRSTPLARIVGQATSGLRAEVRADDAGRSRAARRREGRLGARRTSTSSS